MSGIDHALGQAVERIRAAAADGTVLRIRGGGSKDFYGEAPRGELLDTRALAGISSYEPSELVVTVRAGTPLAELEVALAEKGSAWPSSRRTSRRVRPSAAWSPRASRARRAPAWAMCATTCSAPRWSTAAARC